MSETREKRTKMTKSSKKYKVIPTKEQLDILKLYWKMFKAEEDIFWGKLGELEKGMAKKTGIKDLEFIKDEMMGGEWIGIGNVSRTMKLYQERELE